VSAPDKFFYYNNSSEQEWSALTTWQWRGRVIVEPDKRSDHTKLVVEAKELILIICGSQSGVGC
jgi:hypothetical protein